MSLSFPNTTSPLTHIHETTVPMLVISEADTYDYTRLFEDAVKEAGLDRIRFLHFPDRRHATIGKLMAREEPDEARDAMVAFIRSSSNPPPQDAAQR